MQHGTQRWLRPVWCVWVWYWESVLTFIDVYNEEFDEPQLHHRFVTPTMVEKTIKTLDAYMEGLNAQCDENYSQELYEKIIDLAALTNRWLKATGDKNEMNYYDI